MAEINRKNDAEKEQKKNDKNKLHEEKAPAVAMSLKA